MNIFELLNEYNGLYAKMINYETGEIDEAIAQMVDIKKEEVLTKSEKVGYVIRKLEMSANEIDGEINRLKELKEKCNNTREKLVKGLSMALIGLKVDKIDGINAKISFRQSEETIIDDLDKVPEEFKKATVKYTAKKTEIKDFIKNGGTVDGAHIEIKQNLQVK